MKQSTLSSRQSKKSNIIQAWICALSLGLSSCSPGMFFGNGVDQKVLNLKSSRRINTECGNMDVSTSQFTLTSFRGLVQCLNANRSMEPIAQFVSAISDQDLAPLVHAVNQSLVGQDPHQQKRFYELERTYQSWVQQGIHKDLFKQSGKVLSYSDFWMSLISILRSGFYESGTQTVNLNILKAIELLSAELDSIAFERSLRVGLTYAEAPSFVSLQTHLSDHPLSDAQVTSLAQSFMDFVNQPQGGGAWNQREKFKAEIVWAIQNNRLFPLLDRLLGPSQEQIAIKAPEFAKVFKGLVSTGGALGPSTTLMDDLTAAFRDLSGPVSCMKGSKEIKDATRYLIRELAEFRPTAEARDYITREAPLTFMALGPFCTLPPQMTQHYPAMFRLAESGVLEPMVDLLKVLYAETREIESSALQREVGRGQGTEGEGEVRLDGAALSPVAAIAHDEVKRPWIDLMFAMFLDPGAPHLTPILKTLSEKDAFLDLIFLSHLMVDEDRENLERLLKLMVRPQPTLEQKSIADVFSEAMAQSRVQDLAKLVLFGRKFLDLPDGFLRSLLKTAHQAYYVNQVHPVLSLVREMGSQASTQNRALFEAIFRISEKHPEHLKKSFEFIADLSQGDDLADLTETLFQVTKKMVAQGRQVKNQGVEQGLEAGVHEQVIPTLSTRVRHHLASVERENSSFRSRFEALLRQWGGRLGEFNPIPHPVVTPAPVREECKQFDFSFSLDQYRDPRFAQQLDAFLACQGIGAGPIAQDLSQLMRTMNATRMGSSDQDPTFFAFQVETFHQLFQHFTQEEAKALVEHWMSAYDHSDRRFFRLLDAIPYWVNQPIGRDSETPHPRGAPSIAQSALEVTGAVVSRPQSKEALHTLMASVSGIMRRADFPQLLRDLETVFLSDLPAVPAPVAEGSPEDEIFNQAFREKAKTWVRAKEGWRAGQSCEWDQEHLEARVDELVHEAKTNANNRDLIQIPGQLQKKPRSSWTLNELKSEINPVLDRLRDQRRSDQQSGRYAVDALSKFLRRYSRPSDSDPGQVIDRHGTLARKTPEDLLKWFHDRSRDYKLISYYYPGEEHPRVRAVNSLDRLELTLANVDMVMPAPPHKNLAFQFLSELADAWGDLPRNQWPQEIQEKYPNGRAAPPTLAQAVHHILSRKGLSERLEDLETLTSYVIGLPARHRCDHALLADEVELPIPNEIVIRAAALAFPLLRVTHEQSLEFKRKLYNLWQVKEVLLENIPGSGHAHAGGIEVLRDLFFEIYYSTPREIRNSWTWPSASYIQENNLNLITASVRLGAMRQIGRLVQRFPVDDPFLKDIAMNLIQVGSSPHMGELMRVLLESSSAQIPNDPYRLIWKMTSLIEQASDENLSTLKKSMTHLFAAMNQLDPWSPAAAHQDALMDLFVSQGTKVLRNHYSFLSTAGEANQDLLKSVLFSSAVADQSVNLYSRLKQERVSSEKTRLATLLKDVLDPTDVNAGGDPQAKMDLSAGVEVLKAVVENARSWESLKVLVDQLRVLQDLPEYRALDVYSALKPGLEFFEDNTPAAFRLRMALAQLIHDPHSPGAHRITQILEFAHANPNEFNQLLNVLGQSIERGDLQEFLKVVRRSLPNAEH